MRKVNENYRKNRLRLQNITIIAINTNLCSFLRPWRNWYTRNVEVVVGLARGSSSLLGRTILTIYPDTLEFPLFSGFRKNAKLGA